MKRIFIVDTYPSTPKQEAILHDSINSIKGLGYDIMVVSHYSPSLIKIPDVNYFIYDKNNTFLSSHYTPFWWMNTDSFRIEIYNSGHTLPICRNIRSSTNLAKSIGYGEFIFMESDIIFNHDDLKLLDSELNNMSNQGKKMLFFRPEEYRDCEGSYVYETLLFCGNLEFFTTSFKPPLDEAEWLSIPMGYTLELSFYEQLSKFEDQFYLIHDHSSRIFKNSDVNIYRYGLFNCEMIYNTSDPSRPTLFVINSLINPQPKFYSVIKEDNVIQRGILGKGHYWLKQFDLEDSFVDVIVYEDESEHIPFIKKRFYLNDSNIIEFRNKGIINYK